MLHNKSCWIWKKFDPQIIFQVHSKVKVDFPSFLMQKYDREINFRFRCGIVIICIIFQGIFNHELGLDLGITFEDHL